MPDAHDDPRNLAKKRGKGEGVKGGGCACGAFVCIKREFEKEKGAGEGTRGRWSEPLAAPVLMAPLGEPGVALGARVGDVAREEQHPVVLAHGRRGLEPRHHRGRVQEVAEVEVVILEEAVAEVLPQVVEARAVGTRDAVHAPGARGVEVAAAADHAAPAVVVEERREGGTGKPHLWGCTGGWRGARAVHEGREIKGLSTCITQESLTEHNTSRGVIGMPHAFRAHPCLYLPVCV